MRKLILLLVIMLLVATLFVGCDNTPPPSVVVVEGIVCDGGHYVVYYGDWSITGCEGDPIYPAGTYWLNADKREFLIGDVVADPIGKFGKCPDSYINEI